MNTLALGHCKIDETNDGQEDVDEMYYMPQHHCLCSTTRLRFVFDASAKSSTNVSLDDVLMTGPVVQEDLLSIVLRFRTLKYVFTADICKMYRQIQ